MKYGKTILCSTALATLLAGSALAQQVGETMQETGETATGVMTQTGEMADGAMEGTSAEANVVMSADAQAIGTVDEVQTLSNGETALVIALNDSLGLPVERVRIRADADAEGSYELAMSRAEFVSAINAQIEAQAN
ncbi:hypothetical protein P1J78_11380 [Psychromarinibacter sp. C21-152]|uniref:PRC-barrel domain-containing protein n=1 Tax=Psychromarinibacter sediminicola TaxID=3033385 RepID=A0AAE3NTF3_9RHOB|nr:hypothetical protein [Psychromarinibacter sediminicola]MDF0601334.1 hypothetical protein [Psychromarinibacter sediminicola]